MSFGFGSGNAKSLISENIAQRDEEPMIIVIAPATTNGRTRDNMESENDTRALKAST
jgi:hypothetical protein